MLEEIVAEAGRRGLTLVWCNVREPHSGFHARAGFEVVGETFSFGATELPHVRMEHVFGRIGADARRRS